MKRYEIGPQGRPEQDRLLYTMEKKKRLSLSLKINILIIISILMVFAGLVGISYFFYSQKINNFYFDQVSRAVYAAKENLYSGIVRYLWDQINTDEYRKVRAEAIASDDEDMIRNWMRSRPSFSHFYTMQVIDPEEDPEPDEFSAAQGLADNLYTDYERLLQSLTNCMNSFDISAAYLQYDENGVTYNLADPEEDLFYVGSVEEPIDAFSDYDGTEYLPPIIYHSGFGWLCTALMPLDETLEGKPAGYVGVDTDMNHVVTEQRKFLVNSSIYILVLTGVVILFSMIMMNRIIVNPLEDLAEASAAFVNNDEELTKDNVIQLPIRSNDEIGDLYHQFRDMQTRIIDYTGHLSTIIAERERVNTELQMAESIQRSMLQSSFPAFPDHPEFDLHASMIPAKRVGGDFYDFYLMDDSHLALLIADVSDKGVPAALFMMSAMNLIHYRAQQGGTPSEILMAVNAYICRNNSSKMFVTVWMGILDLDTGVMTCANAGHEYPFIRSAGGKFRLLRDKHGLVIGGMPATRYTDYDLDLKPGDAVFVYTDGVTEACSAEGKFFGMDRLAETLDRSADGTPGDILRSVKADVDAFVDSAKQFDDLTMLCIEYKGRGC